MRLPTHPSHHLTTSPKNPALFPSISIDRSADGPPITAGMNRHLIELVQWFQIQTAAKDPKVYEVGETTFELIPTQRASSKLANNVIPLRGNIKKYKEDNKITHEIMALASKATTSSGIITLQTILPLLLTVGNHSGLKTPREVLIEGATNCPDSPSFEYLKQIFEPALLQYFGIELDCELVKRGWGAFPVSKGQIRVKFTPMAIDTFIYPQEPAKLGISEEEPTEACIQQEGSDVIFSTDVEVETEVQRVVATIVGPTSIHEILQDTVRLAISRVFNYLDEDDKDAIEINTEASTHTQHVYVLLVAHSDTCRWGRDWINSESMGKRADLKGFVKEEMLRLCADLEKEVSGASECPVDQFLQDQLVVYQALAKGSSSFQRQRVGSGPEDGAPLDSEHVRRARASAEKMLGAKFTEGGALCLGAGVKVGEHVKVHVEKKQQLGKQEAIQFA